MVFCKRNADQSELLKGAYIFLSIQGILAFIQLSRSSTQFCLILVKFYYNFIIKIDENLDKNMENTLLKIRDNFKYQDVSSIYFPAKFLLMLVSLISLVS